MWVLHSWLFKTQTELESVGVSAPSEQSRSGCQNRLEKLNFSKSLPKIVSEGVDSACEPLSRTCPGVHSLVAGRCCSRFQKQNLFPTMMF